MTTLAASISSDPRLRAIRDALSAEGASWLVGGTVRDALLGRPLEDIDLAVSTDPEQAARALARALRGAVFKLSEAFGAWRVVVHDAGFNCDVSPLHGATIEEDLAGRDFSINAMALPLEGGEPIDPHGGRRDLAARTLRVLGGPTVGASSYAGDPLRPLRLVRLATELAFAPDGQTERLTKEAAPLVVRAAPERIFAELRRLLVAARVLEGVELGDRLGLIAAVLPELAALHGVEQSHFHHLDVYGHTLEVLRQQLVIEAAPEDVFGELGERVRTALREPLADELSRAQALRLAALLHDIGKPATRGMLASGRITFKGHDAVGADMIDGICRRLRTSERLREFLSQIARRHLVLGFLVHERPLSRRAAYRYLKACSPVEVEVTALSCADRLATRGKNADAAIDLHLELARELMSAALDWRSAGPPKPAVRGDSLARELGIPPGPELGALLAELAEARYSGEAATREDALALARRLQAARRRGG